MDTAIVENTGEGSIGPFSFFTDGSGGDLLTLQEKNGREIIYGRPKSV